MGLTHSGVNGITLLLLGPVSEPVVAGGQQGCRWVLNVSRGSATPERPSPRAVRLNPDEEQLPLEVPDGFYWKL